MQTMLPPSPSGRLAIRERMAAAASGLRRECDEDGWWTLEFHALGSPCELFFQCTDVATAREFTAAALSWLAEFEGNFSRFISDSWLSQLNAQAGNGRWIPTDETAEALLGLCHHAHFLSNGAFDATSLPLSRLWDWKTKHSSLPSDQEISDALKNIGWEKVERKSGAVRLPFTGMELDFGGVGKEFAVDAMIYLMERHGLSNAMADLGRDIRVLGSPPEGGNSWTIGLEIPQLDENGQTECYGVIPLRSGAAVATSGDYRRCFVQNGRRYGHILDCQTGRPVAHNTSAVTVVAKTCITAGCTATAAMVLGGEKALRLVEGMPQVESLVWQGDQKLLSRGFRLLPVPENWSH